jgi:hypothetical protein
MRAMNYFQIFIFLFFMFLIFYLQFPIQSIIVIGIFMFVLLLFKGKLYNKTDKIIRKNFPFLSKFPKWAVKLTIIIIFIIIYLIAKELMVVILKIFGLDLRKAMLDGINQSYK